MNLRLLPAVLAMGLFLSVGMARASDEPQQPQTVGEILQVQHELRQDLDKPNGAYSRFSDRDVDQMNRPSRLGGIGATTFRCDTSECPMVDAVG